MTEANRGMGKLIGRLRTTGWQELVFGSLLIVFGYALIVGALMGIVPHRGDSIFVMLPFFLLNGAAGGWRQSDETDWYAEAIGFRHAALVAGGILLLFGQGLLFMPPRNPLDYLYMAIGCVALQRATCALLNRAPPKMADDDAATHPA